MHIFAWRSAGPVTNSHDPSKTMWSGFQGIYCLSRTRPINQTDLYKNETCLSKSNDCSNNEYLLMACEELFSKQHALKCSVASKQMLVKFFIWVLPSFSTLDLFTREGKHAIEKKAKTCLLFLQSNSVDKTKASFVIYICSELCLIIFRICVKADSS